jgi:hypothetical protein
MKLARQYFVEIGQPQRTKFIARWQSYHGNTLGALAAGGNKARRDMFQPLLIDVSHIPPCFAFREKSTDETDEAYGQRVANALEAEILRLGPDTVIGFMAETVVGATAGAVPPVPGYFKRVREICDKYGVLLMLDEVMSGMGRTGTLFACEQDGIAPDLLTCAKGLGAGYQAIGACLVSGKIYESVSAGTGFFQHGFTYIGHPTSCAAGLAVQQTIEREGLLENVREKGEMLRERLGERFGNHRHVADIRGRGLFVGVELVADRGTLEPFSPAAKLNGRIKSQAMARGLMCYPNGGTLDGARGDHVLLAPPFIVTEAHVDSIVDILAQSIDAAIAEIPDDLKKPAAAPA